MPKIDISSSTAKTVTVRKQFEKRTAYYGFYVEKYIKRVSFESSKWDGRASIKI